MKCVEPGFSFHSLINKENSLLNQSEKLSPVDNCIKASHCKKLDGLTVVAKPDGLIANAPQFKLAYVKKTTWLISLIEPLKNLAAHFGIGVHSAAKQKALVESAGAGKKPVAKFSPMSMLGRRISSETQRKALEIMVGKTFVTRRELDSYLGVLNSPDVVMRMARSCGWQIHKVDYSKVDGEGARKRRYFYYMLDSLDRSIAAGMLRMDANLTAAPTTAAIR